MKIFAIPSTLDPDTFMTVNDERKHSIPKLHCGWSTQRILFGDTFKRTHV